MNNSDKEILRKGIEKEISIPTSKDTMTYIKKWSEYFMDRGEFNIKKEIDKYIKISRRGN